jgi:hypothetical protein
VAAICRKINDVCDVESGVKWIAKLSGAALAAIVWSKRKTPGAYQ